MSIYVITHKEFDNKICKDRDIYEYMLVGANDNKCSLVHYSDNCGVNISNKNFKYCELTGIYWIRYNRSDDFVGICHYRRFFSKTHYFFQKYFIIKPQKIYKILKQGNIIVPKRYRSQYQYLNAKEFFCISHGQEVWTIMEKVLEELYPDYLEDLYWFAEEKKGYSYNMFIMKREQFNEYSDWLFSILFEMEKIILKEKTVNENRLYGFVSERLLNIWIHHNNLKCKEFDIYNTEKNFRKRINTWIKYRINKIKNRIG